MSRDRQFPGGRGRGSGTPISGVAVKAFTVLGKPAAAGVAGNDGASGSGAAAATGTPPP